MRTLRNITRVSLGYAPRREMQAKGLKKGYPGTFGYAPNEVLDKETEMSRQAGGGWWWWRRRRDGM